MALTAIAFKRNASGTIRWWDGTDFTSTTEQWIAQTSEEVVFPADSWDAGSYTWTIATKDSSGTAGPYATERAVTFTTGTPGEKKGWGIKA